MAYPLKKVLAKRVQPGKPREDKVVPIKLRGTLVGLLVSLAFAQPSGAMTRIADDMGGPLGQYLLMFATIRDSGERVMIDGSCFSACTLVTALIPGDKICI